MKVSAIIPNYNSANDLPCAIASLAGQTVPFDEIIIVDDGSTDNSLRVIDTLMRRHKNIRLICHEKNQGVAAALNTGIDAAKSDYILLGAADDTYGRRLVEKSIAVIEKYPMVGLICGNAVVTRYDLKQPFLRKLPFPTDRMISPQEFKDITRKTYVGFNGGGGMLLNREVVMQAGALHAETKWHCDWLLYFVAAYKQGIFYIDDIFVNIHMRETCYGEGKKNKNVQNTVMLDTVHALNRFYPELWKDFRDAGLVPHYSLRYIKLFLSDPVARQFVTRKLLWKLFINNAMVVRIGRLFPYRMILGMRKLLRA